MMEKKSLGLESNLKEALAHQIYTLIYPVLNTEKNKNTINKSLLALRGNTTLLQV